MPMRSRAQRKWMHANKPELAKRWEAETPAKPLPKRLGMPKPGKRPNKRKE